MSLIKLVRVLGEKIGTEPAEALVESLEAWLAEEKRDVISRVDEKINARQDLIQRRIHEDIAGVEIRLTTRMADLESKLGTRMADFESKLGSQMSGVKQEILALELKIARDMADLKVSLLRWFMTAVLLQVGLLTLVSWATKALF